MGQHKLSLGPDVVRMLIPHRRPFIMVDRITYLEDAAQPVLRAAKYLSMNEPFFAGHFPDIALMPGAMLFEGLGQTANILAVLLEMIKLYEKEKAGVEALIEDLANVEQGFALSRAYRPDKVKRLNAIGMNGPAPYGLVGSVKLKFLEPISAGNLIEYEATLKATIDQYLHYGLVATVNGREKARGTISSIRNEGTLRFPHVRQ